MKIVGGPIIMVRCSRCGNSMYIQHGTKIPECNMCKNLSDRKASLMLLDPYGAKIDIKNNLRYNRKEAMKDLVNIYRTEKDWEENHTKGEFLLKTTFIKNEPFVKVKLLCKFFVHISEALSEFDSIEIAEAIKVLAEELENKINKGE